MPVATIQVLSQNSYHSVQLLKMHFAIVLHCKCDYWPAWQRINLKKIILWSRRFENSSLINETVETTMGYLNKIKLSHFTKQ